MSSLAPAPRFQRSRNGCLTCKAKRKKCDEKRPSCSRCSRVGSSCTWPSAQYDCDPWTEFSFEDWETIGKLLQPASYSKDQNTLEFFTSEPVQGQSFTEQNEPFIDTDSGASGLGQALNNFGSYSSLINYHDPSHLLTMDGSGSADTRVLTVSSKLWEYAQDYGPKVMWPPADEKDGFDPEGIMPLVQQSISMLKITDDPVFQDVRDFFANFMSRFYYDYAAIHDNIHVRIRRRFEASNTLRQGMLGMAALFRSNYQHSLEPASMRNYAKELHRLASHTLQIELESNCISPWVKLAGLWELMNYEYFDGNLVSYYSHLNQAASIVRLAVGGNNIDILKLSGEQTFDLRCFAWCDVLSSMALARPTLLSYESDIHGPPQDGDFVDPDKGLEWIFGCPDVLVILMARTSAARHARISPEEKAARGQELQRLIVEWKFRPVFAQRSSLRVARLAAQEIWRHAAILYVHQSIFKSNSGHPDVKNSVKLIIQIASTLTPGVNPDCFLSVPYFIAGSFSTTQKDRRTLRSRLLTSGNERFLRDLVAALDDLWKETDATGSSTTWSKQHPPRIIF